MSAESKASAERTKRKRARARRVLSRRRKR